MARFLFGLTLVAALTVTSLAWAQDDEYRTLTASAVQEHERGNFREARALFARAHAISPNARTLWGMGVAAFEDRQYAEAVKRLRESLLHPEKPLTDTQRTHAQELIQRSAAFTVSLSLYLNPSHARFIIDGVEIPHASEVPLIVDGGKHHIVAASPEHKTYVRDVSFAPGQPVTLDIQLEPEVMASLPTAQEVIHHSVAQAMPDPALPPPAQRPKKRPWRTVKWVSLSFAAVSTATGILGYALRESAARTYNDDIECPDPKQRSCARWRDAVGRRQATAITGGVLSGVFGATTTVAFFLDNDSEEKPPTSTAALRCGPMFQPGIVCGLSF
jgi:hypothetical protein